MAGIALPGPKIELNGGEMRLNRDNNGSNWRNFARLLLGVALVMTGMAQGARAQEAEEQKPCPVKTPPPPETYMTVYLANVSQPQDANDLQTAVRNMVSRARVYYDPSANAISLRGNAEDLALAQKVIADLDRPKKAYRLESTFLTNPLHLVNGCRVGVGPVNHSRPAAPSAAHLAFPPIIAPM